jgi:putative glutamine amidotransferase
VSLVEGLLLTGGGDVDPRHYGQTPLAEVGGVDADRDSWEIGLVRQALGRALPVLGICRGCQVLNVARGGTLLQHLPNRSVQPHLVVERDRVAHSVQIESGSQLSAVEGCDSMGVNSVHHQAVDSVGQDLRAVAWAEDGIVEAVEHLYAPAIGVQWHPENLLGLDSHMAVFRWLVDQAANFKAPHGAAPSARRPFEVDPGD